MRASWTFVGRQSGGALVDMVLGISGVIWPRSQITDSILIVGFTPIKDQHKNFIFYKLTRSALVVSDRVLGTL